MLLPPPLRRARGLPRGGGPRACLDAALSLRVSFCLLLCAGVRRSPLCVFCLFKLQDGSLRGGGGRQAGVGRWRLGPEQEPTRNPRAGLRDGGCLQAVESAEGADYGFVQPHSRPAELFHRQQIPVHLRRREHCQEVRQEAHRLAISFLTHHNSPLPLCCSSGEGGQLAWNLSPTPSWCQSAPLQKCTLYSVPSKGQAWCHGYLFGALVFYKVRLLVFDFSCVEISSVSECVVLRCLPLLGLGFV